MLILRRRVGESIIIAGNIRITVEAIEGKRAVKLSIEAPQEVKIIREEIAEFSNVEVREVEDGHYTQRPVKKHQG